jgi:hypothetical protein
MKKPWTNEELAVLASCADDKAVAAKLGRSWHSVRFKRRNCVLANVTPPAPVGKPLVGVFAEEAKQESPETFDDDKLRAQSELWKKKFQVLSGKYEKALHEVSVVEQLVSEIRDVAPLSYSPLPAVYNLRKTSDSQPQSAVLLFSDTHVGKVVLPDQTLGFGNYNFNVFLNRLKYLEESVISIVKNHTNAKLDELVVAMMGDMLDGALVHSVEAGQVHTLFAQFYGAGHAIAQFLRNLAPHFPSLRVHTVCGNHPRWQNQHKMPSVNRFSNLDMFLYALCEALTRDVKNIRWDLNQQPFQVFDVQGFTFKESHGDHLRGGDKALGIPNHSIGREVSVTSQLYSKHGKQAPHYYICGHLHRGIQLPHATGEIIINGGFPGLDNYALAENFNPVDPMQRLLFVHPKYGRTAEYPLSLQFAEAGPVPYDIPGGFIQ